MKKLHMILLSCLIILTLITGCTSHKVASSSMLRTVGVNETALPIGKGTIAFEFINNRAATVDVITELTYQDWPEEENLLIHGSKVKDYCRYNGFNARVGIDNSTEIKVGFLTGSIDNGYNYEYQENEFGTALTTITDLNTGFSGYQVGLKRLLTDYKYPHRVTLYLDGKYITFVSDESVKQYDGYNLEFKTALIYGYLKNPEKRTFPSMSLYYSQANTNRNESLAFLPRVKKLQAVGAEFNVNIDMGLIYAILATGLEKEITEKTTDELIPYFGMKIGFHLRANK